MVAATVGLVLSGIMAFAAAEETSTAIWLNVMHVAAAWPIVGFLARALPERRVSAATSTAAVTIAP